MEKIEEKRINGRPDFNAREVLSEFRNRHDEEAIDNAIYEAEKEFAETGEYIEAKEAFDILDKEFDFDSMNVRPNPYAKILKEQNAHIMGNEYIHYGSSKLHEISPIRNEHCFTKPHGGLWASPIDAQFGWKDWCLRENFCIGKLERSFIFKLKPSAKIIHIYSIDDLEGLPQLEHELSSWTTLDFEQLAKEYDGIELHLSEERPPKKKKKRGWNNLYFELYGWDCDSILLFNTDCIIQSEKG